MNWLVLCKMNRLLLLTFSILIIGIPSVYAHPFLLDSEPSQAANAPIGTTQIITFYSEAIEIDFPYFLDKQNTEHRQHDFVFVRDLFVSDQNGKVIISKFREKARQVEADIMQIMLESMRYKTIRIPENSTATAEGGEFYYCPGAVSYTHLTLPTNREV